LGNMGEMDDPEIDLRLDPTGAGSRTVTYGEPALAKAHINAVSLFFVCEFVL